MGLYSIIPGFCGAPWVVVGAPRIVTTFHPTSNGPARCPTRSWRNGDAQCCQLSNIADPFSDVFPFKIAPKPSFWESPVLPIDCINTGTAARARGLALPARAHLACSLSLSLSASALFSTWLLDFILNLFLKKKKKTFPLSFSPSLASLYLFEQWLRLGVTSTSSVWLPLQDESLHVFPNCKSLWIKASAKWLNVNVNVNVNVAERTSAFS